MYSEGPVRGDRMKTVAVGKVDGVGLNTYQLYVPDSHTSKSRVVVVVHGEPNKDEDVTALAAGFQLLASTIVA